MKDIAFVLYPGCTPLDLVGPLQVLNALSRLVPDHRTVVVGESLDPVYTDLPLLLAASHTYEQITDPYAVVLPGGLQPTLEGLADERLLARIRGLAEGAEVIGSVCTGSLLLAAAGLLAGRRATTHWMFRDLLAKYGATPVAQRWVEDGPVITAAGVAAGIDMALHLVQRLAGKEIAAEVQLLIEYDPQPPLGPIDWSTVDLAARKPVSDAILAQSLAEHPELLSRLSG
ncbi:DJ-1/PfpI family protein [Kutzneria viridogrisea]|uniref:DJ-1/PfpI domain-containing protein n=2 Tax=Kutzneria TaxID=43356 RepID=W5WVK0_9PSEU|nr:DJ-1/PfpI family protein [Kutzneria albida]AHI02145.1 hypothetical protein KALB_8788 [Kutzneria albida DSM 43870]MBA8929292.1 transcriptional regulator GlxA family with amidase domain [Kutzneria viridogrisea]